MNTSDSKGKIIEAGFGRSDITPGLSVRLGGYGVEKRFPETINDQLNATSLFLRQDEKKVIVINLDWLAIEEDDTDTIQKLINAETGILEENIIITTIHSHTAPNTMKIAGWGAKESEYIEKAIPKIAASAVEAVDNARSVEIGAGSISSETGINRREIQKDGSIFFGGDPHGNLDPEMTVISFRNESGIAGMIVHYGAHATAWGNVPIVSRDWPGVMVDRIEKQIKAPVMFINGAIGDIGPRTNFLREDGSFSAGGGRDVDAVREVGYRAATDALHAFVGIKNYSADIPMNIISRNILLPYAPLHDLKTAEREIAKLEPDKNKYGSPMFMYTHWKAVVGEYKKPENERAKGKNYLQSILRLGDIVLIPFPGEIFSAISLRIRKASPFQYTLCSSVTNGCAGYIPAREARHRGGYEVWFSNHLNCGYGWAENIDDIIVTEVSQRLDKLKSR